MPRDPAGTYSYPPGIEGIPDQTIESADYNSFLLDVQQDLNLPRPIVAGGTGAANSDAALTNLSAEKYKQVVTNWDSTVWMAGSYYAATTASGTAPVAGHAFAGTAYYANATDLVLEATDLADPTTPISYTRVMASGVWSPWYRTGGTGTAGSQIGEFLFDAGVTFPPPAGTIRFNNATQNSTTELFISHLSATGVDVTTSLPFVLRNGYEVAVQDKSNIAKYKIFTITADPVLSGSDVRVLATLKTSGVDLTAQRVLINTSSGAIAAPFIDAMACNGMQINGSFEISQERAIGATVTGAGSIYICDGWIQQVFGSMGISGAISTWSVSNACGFPNVIFMQTTAAQASLGANDRNYLSQPIEGYRIGRLAWGTANAQPITLGFWSAHHRTGLYSGSINSANVTIQSYVFTYTQAAADTPQYNVVTIPGCPSSVWKTDNTVGMFVCFANAAGVNFTSSTTNAWQPGTFIAAPGQVNGVAATSDVFRIFGVVVLPGTLALTSAKSSFLMRPYDEELITCLRYWESGIAGGATNNDGTFATGAIATQVIEFKVVKRAIPTSSITDTANGVPNAKFNSSLGLVGTPGQSVTAGGAITNLSINEFTSDFGSSGTASNRWSFKWMMDARL